MFREMRRKNQQLAAEECVQVLERCTSGVLALSGDDDYPYAVPMSHFYSDGKIYFHSAVQGHKLDAIARNEKASFCVIDQDQVIPETYTTHFRSVIAFGRIRVIDDPEAKRAAIDRLAARFRPGHEQERKAEIDGALSRLCMLEMTIDHLSGKEAIELMRARKEAK
ncbi:MAG: pyridoxamine 5'-phosphate oxidase family protein [Clostridia bacterium]|nr:pyridoxamine 5'-phosphate oxidase family protein [Clostridia bacterium]